MTLPNPQASNVAKYLRPATLRSPGPTVIDADHRRVAGPETSREIGVCCFPAGGRRGSRASSSGEETGAATHTGYALVEVHVADGTGTPTPGELLDWQGETLEILDVSRWAGGAGQITTGENAKTFFEFSAKRIGRASS